MNITFGLVAVGSDKYVKVEDDIGGGLFGPQKLVVGSAPWDVTVVADSEDGYKFGSIKLEVAGVDSNGNAGSYKRRPGVWPVEGGVNYPIDNSHLT